MRAVRILSEPVSCDYCGAVASRPHGNPFGMCYHCYFDFQCRLRKNPGCFDGETEGAALAYMADRLRLAAERMAAKGFVGRCQCAARSGAGYNGIGPRIYQCGYSASQKTADGHLVCGTHALLLSRGQDLPFVPMPIETTYDYFTDAFRRLAAVDPHFRSALERALP